MVKYHHWQQQKQDNWYISWCNETRNAVIYGEEGYSSNHRHIKRHIVEKVKGYV